MIPVKTMPRFKCEFCKKRGIKRKIEWHEKQCYRNPNRFCSTCQNKGEVDSGFEGRMIPCAYCEKFDPDFMKNLWKSFEYEVDI